MFYYSQTIMKLIYITLFFLTSIFSVSDCNADNGSPLSKDSVRTNLNLQLVLYPQEKIYVQTDKPYYITGEKMFFRAFLLNALSHEPVYWSRYIYFELINPVDSIIIRQQVRLHENVFYGNFDLSEDIPQGNYRIRAYTRYMENMDVEYFYTQSVFIADPQMLKIETEIQYEYLTQNELNVELCFRDKDTKEAIIPNEFLIRLNQEVERNLKANKDGLINMKLKMKPEEKNNSLFLKLKYDDGLFAQYIMLPRPVEEFEMRFYPEGGYLISDRQVAVAFEIHSPVAFDEPIVGELFDSQSNKILDFKPTHENMGYFLFQPQRGKKYHVEVSYKGKKKQFDLPEVRSDTYALQAKSHWDKLWISVNKPDNLSWKKMYLLIHVRGAIVYFDEWDNNIESILFDKNEIPSGVSQVLLLTEDLEPLSERLLFINNMESVKFDFQTEKEGYKKREKVSLTIGPDYSTRVNSWDFAISITDDNQVIPDTTSNIQTYILLTSELKGFVSNPIHYFQEKSLRRAIETDILMMTKGWKRYQVPKVIRGEFDIPQIMAEKSQTISGKVESVLFSKPRANADVSVFSVNASFFDVIKTDENGSFLLDRIEFPDSAEFIIQALNQKGSDRVELLLDERTFPKIASSFYVPDVMSTLRKTGYFDEYVKMADLKYTYENEMRMIYLPEITVKGRQPNSKYESRYGLNPDVVVNEAEIERNGSLDILTLLSMQAGVMRNGASLSIRGASQPPLLIVDGVIRSDFSEIELIPTTDVGQINILKDAASLAMLGSRGANGAIEIITKTGKVSTSSWTKFNRSILKPLGYTTPVEFYSPVYDSSSNYNDPKPDLRSTIYWTPSVSINESESKEISFYTSDQNTTYTITLEGIGQNGQLIYQRVPKFLKVSAE